jgi:hypothetical protein
MFLLKVALALIPIRSQYTPAGRLSRFSSGKNRPALAFSGTLSPDIGSGCPGEGRLRLDGIGVDTWGVEGPACAQYSTRSGCAGGVLEAMEAITVSEAVAMISTPFVTSA